jgi:hypothetical protein
MGGLLLMVELLRDENLGDDGDVEFRELIMGILIGREYGLMRLFAGTNGSIRDGTH